MSKSVRVILTAPIPGIGKAGDIVQVSGGFARNKLFPEKLAVPATEQAVQQTIARAKQQREEEIRQQAGFRALRERVQKLHLVLHANANEKGALYGSVKPADVIEALQKAGMRGIAETYIRFSAPVDRIGTASLELHLPGQPPLTLSISVEPQSS